ncbi:hypothetical protein BDV96DRAFT_642492 [Lophiotrema nucula]|uniref:DUF7732 domain-containing protein n=1 Tax=Lophiotrema nucula TaxID=690887 RepID=A0A6A5ZIP0_9PLEO|nr:hypothetical protein BDV96DRAFT_642492 [Lophiotrema nucula]
MRITQFFAYCIFATAAVKAASLPNTNALELLEAHAGSAARSDILSPEHALEKRKGGGGKGGGGGGGGGGGKTSGGGGGSSRSSTSSNVGGATKAGSGVPRSYGGGGYYGGGASVPYQAGRRSGGGLLPGAFLGIGAAALIFPGLWLYSVYPYYLHPYSFYNRTYVNDTVNGLNQTLPVTCLCQDYAVCGCDNNDNAQYINDLVGNGSYAALNKSLVTVSRVNDTDSLVINGTLPNGTTASGGTDDAATGLSVQWSGYWIMGAIFFYAAALL